MLTCTACEKPFEHWATRFLQPAGKKEWCDDCNRAAQVRVQIDRGTPMPAHHASVISDMDPSRKKRAERFGVEALTVAEMYAG